MGSLGGGWSLLSFKRERTMGMHDEPMRSTNSFVASVRTVMFASASGSTNAFGVGRGEVRAAAGSWRGALRRAGVDDAPDAAALAVALGVVERHFVVADDAVVEVGDVERAVGAELDVDGPEPGVVAGR